VRRTARVRRTEAFDAEHAQAASGGVRRDGAPHSTQAEHDRVVPHAF
jgi:hypothetical protein